MKIVHTTDNAPQHKRAWDIRPYPCIGAWNFLPCFSTYMPAYPKVLERVKKGATFLDTGCCLGQDLRKMVANGALSTHMYGCDIADGFWELGYELFQDNDTLQAKFMLADIFDLDSSLKTLRGSVDILYLGAVLHLFSWQEQVDALVALVPLSKVGSTMFGFGVGWVNGREFETKWKNATKSMFYHDNETMQVMWQKVSKASGTKWEVKADLWKMERFFIVSQDWDWLGPDARMSLFEAMRVE